MNGTGFTAVLSGAVVLYLFARSLAQSLLPPPLPLPPFLPFRKVRDPLRLDPCLQDLGRPVHVSFVFVRP